MAPFGAKLLLSIHSARFPSFVLLSPLPLADFSSAEFLNLFLEMVAATATDATPAVAVENKENAAVVEVCPLLPLIRGHPPPAMSTYPTFQQQRLTVRFVKLSEKAHMPTYGSAAAAGADLYSAEECVVPAGGKPPLLLIFPLK